MKLLLRNKTKFDYFPYTGTDTDLNDDGEHTGEYHHEYGEAVPMTGNISIPSGYTNQTFYGEDIRYTHTLIMDNPNAEIDEFGEISWKGELYDILAIRRSMNSLTAALIRHTVDHSEEDSEYEPDPDPEPDPEPEPDPDDGEEDEPDNTDGGNG